MNIHDLQVYFSRFRDILRLERSLQRLAKMPNLVRQLHVSFTCSLSSLAMVFFLRPFLWGILVFLICGNLSANSSNCFTANLNPNYDTSLN